jgi:hypothetical protein
MSHHIKGEKGKDAGAMKDGNAGGAKSTGASKGGADKGTKAK